MTEILLAVSVVVLQLIAAVLLHIKLLIFDLPATAAKADHLGDVPLINFEIGDPRVGIQPLALAIAFPHFNQADPDAPTGCKWRLADEAVFKKALLSFIKLTCWARSG